MTRIHRVTARVVPVAEDGSCLLLLERNPARPDGPHWCPVGGAVDPGEGRPDAAVRELHEETGLVVAPDELVGPVARVAAEFSWDGVDYSGDSSVFAVPMPASSPVSFEHLQPDEIDTVVEARWLTPDQAAADGRLVWPDLPDVMSRAVAAVRGQR